MFNLDAGLIRANTSKRDARKSNFVLISEGYDRSWLKEFEGRAVELGHNLTQISTSLVRDIFNKVTDQNEFAERFAESVFILPAGEQCLKSLLVDPKVLELLKISAGRRSTVAIAQGAETLLPHIPFELRIPQTCIKLQRNQSPRKFAEQVFLS